jgi:hypothetical protein
MGWEASPCYIWNTSPVSLYTYLPIDSNHCIPALSLMHLVPQWHTLLCE